MPSGNSAKRKRFGEGLNNALVRAVHDGGAWDGEWIATLTHDDYLSALGAIAVEFQALENSMHLLLAALIGGEADYGQNCEKARLIYQNLKPSSARLGLMRQLLAVAPWNNDKGEEYDAILNEFQSVSEDRNKFIHGSWMTRKSDSKVLIREKEGFGSPFLGCRDVPVDELDALVNRIGALHSRIFHDLYMADQRRRGLLRNLGDAVAE